MSSAGWGYFLRAALRRPALFAAARVLMTAMALAKSTEEPWRQAVEPSAVARGVLPKPTPPSKITVDLSLINSRRKWLCPWRRLMRVGQSQRNGSQGLLTGK